MTSVVSFVKLHRLPVGDTGGEDMKRIWHIITLPFVVVSGVICLAFESRPPNEFHRSFASDEVVRLFRNKRRIDRRRADVRNR